MAAAQRELTGHASAANLLSKPGISEGGGYGGVLISPLTGSWPIGLPFNPPDETGVTERLHVILNDVDT